MGEPLKDKGILEMKEELPDLKGFAQAMANAGRQVKIATGENMFYGRDVKSAVDWLRMILCTGNNVDMDDNPLVCRDSLKKGSYNKRRCVYCKQLDEAFPDLIPISHIKRK